MDGQSINHRASDGRKQLPSLRSAVPARIDWNARLAEAEARLKPAEPRTAMAEIAACLTLVAPAGMSAEDRTEWLKVARATIGDVSAGALQAGCAEARKKVRRVSDLVPTIIEETRAAAAKLYSEIDSIKFRIANPIRPMLERPKDDRPLTVDELLRMSPSFRSLARRNALASPETFAEVDRILEERQREAGEECRDAST